MQTINRFSYCAGSLLFWSEHHSGQNSRGYAILSRIAAQYSPGMSYTGWESLDDDARDVYRAWCRKEGEPCQYDQLQYLLEQSDCFDLEDPCVEYFMDRYGEDTLEDTGLVNYETSDFVNLDMPYTRDLLRFYSDHSDAILYWVDQYCDAAGLNSRLQALEGQTIEDPDDMAAALVSLAMTYLGGSILQTLKDVKSCPTR